MAEIPWARLHGCGWAWRWAELSAAGTRAGGACSEAWAALHTQGERKPPSCCCGEQNLSVCLVLGIKSKKWEKVRTERQCFLSSLLSWFAKLFIVASALCLHVLETEMGTYINCVTSLLCLLSVLSHYCDSLRSCSEQITGVWRTCTVSWWSATWMLWTSSRGGGQTLQPSRAAGSWSQITTFWHGTLHSMKRVPYCFIFTDTGLGNTHFQDLGQWENCFVFLPDVRSYHPWNISMFAWGWQEICQEFLL